MYVIKEQRKGNVKYNLKNFNYYQKEIKKFYILYKMMKNEIKRDKIELNTCIIRTKYLFLCT